MSLSNNKNKATPKDTPTKAELDENQTPNRIVDNHSQGVWSGHQQGLKPTAKKAISCSLRDRRGITQHFQAITRAKCFPVRLNPSAVQTKSQRRMQSAALQKGSCKQKARNKGSLPRWSFLSFKWRRTRLPHLTRWGERTCPVIGPWQVGDPR